MCQNVELSAISFRICREFYIWGAQVSESVELSPKYCSHVAEAPLPARPDLPIVLHFGNMEVPKRRTIADFILDLLRVIHFGKPVFLKCGQSVELSAISPILGKFRRNRHWKTIDLGILPRRSRRGVTTGRTNPDKRARFSDDARSTRQIHSNNILHGFWA